MNAVDGVADILPGGDDDGEGEQDHGGDAPAPHNSRVSVIFSAANRLIGEVVQSRRRPLLGPSPG